ncbi:protein-glutamate O-methyltransferase CheR [Acidisphaera sp. S103]|uniref:CheR family methyltransferase n=1 Tax=Acidisphaera sp. S103 TaxID=1747223 RepID=UPI00131AEDA5|nr:protein-glutamate O-methyltransferase CheR [Acidisphaera sp. S103]
MNGLIDHDELERFRTTIAVRIGLRFDDGKLGFLGNVLRRRLSDLGQTSDAYLDALEQRPSAAEISTLAGELTVCETYFFRNGEQFRALAEVALPERMRARRTPGELRLLSAGCASGEEAYSLAIVARETITDPAWDIRVRAIDINPIALAKAAAARYSPWALRDTPLSQQQKWFRPDGRDMRLDETVRRSVRIEAGNLVRDDPGLWQPASYDVIFCRNVLMYFAPEQMRLAIARIARSLAPGGFLFLGHAETLHGVSDAFYLHHTHSTFYYQLREGGRSVSPPAMSGFEIAAEPPRAPIAALGETWFETIRSATERVAALVPPEPVETIPRPGVAWDPAPVLDLLRRERFADALDTLRGRPPASVDDRDTLLLEAALLAHSGQLPAAEVACRRLIAIDAANAGAHYVLALCREHAGDLDGAGESDRTAVWLDPAFAMPRLHLGLLARRAGDPKAALRELKHALILLKREETSRILLFGGGFNREALVALCNSARQECEGRP